MKGENIGNRNRQGKFYISNFYIIIYWLKII